MRPSEFDGEGRSMLVLRRERLAVNSTLHGATATDAKANVPTADFGPVTELVVNASGEGKGGEGLNLASGKLVDVPKEFGQWSAQQQNEWSTKGSIDLVVDLIIGTGGPSNKSVALVPNGLKLGAIQGRFDSITKKTIWPWDQATGEELRLALASPTPGTAVIEGQGPFDRTAIVSERRGITYYEIPAGSEFLPATFAFQTRKGELGILQVIRFTEDPRGMRIRYKLVQSPPATSPPISKESPDKQTAEFRSMLGLWKVVRIDTSEAGSRLQCAKRLDLNLTELDIICPGKADRFSYRLSVDPTTTPKTIDLFSDFDKKNLSWLGVYQLDNGRLTISLNEYVPAIRTEQRPSGFGRTNGDAVLVLERYQLSAGEAALKGRWTVTSHIEEGETSRRPMSRQGESLTLGASGVLYADVLLDKEKYAILGGTYLVGPDKEPRTITFFSTLQPVRSNLPFIADAKLAAIYKLDNDRLSIAFRHGGPRPEKFESTPDSGVTLLVLERGELKPAASKTTAETPSRANVRGRAGGTSLDHEARFESLLRRFDTNGNGMIDAEESAQNPFMERMLGRLGIEAKYPIRIDTIIKAPASPDRNKSKDSSENASPSSLPSTSPKRSSTNGKASTSPKMEAKPPAVSPAAELKALTDKAEIIAALKRRNAYFRSGDVTWTAKRTKTRYSKPGLKGYDVEEHLISSGDIHVDPVRFAFDGEKKMYYDTATSDFGTEGQGQPWQRIISAFNGHENRNYSPPGNPIRKGFGLGDIYSDGQQYTDLENINFRAVVLACRPLHPVLCDLDSAAYTLVPGETMIDGHRCVELRETPETEYPGHWRTFWLDRDRDYVIVKHESRYRHFRGKGAGGTGTSVTVSYQNDAVHGWVPSGWKTIWINSETGALFNVVEAKVTKYAFNVDIPSELFDLPFPPSTYVQDSKQQTHWVALPGGRKRVLSVADRKANLSYDELLKMEPKSESPTPAAGPKPETRSDATTIPPTRNGNPAK